MQFVTDLHLHSKYSRAVSPQMVLPVMAEYAAQKGLDILTAGDFTHPLWLKEIKEQLEEAGVGVYKLKSPTQSLNNEKEVLFLLSTEISSIYKQGEKLRRIHNLVFMPDFEAVEKFNSALRSRGCNLNADGRPIIGLSSRNLLELILTIDERAFLIPCHVWTPHFGLYGSASGFNSIEESFGELSKYIYGIETGISSDPAMNWQIADLKNRSILSFSDAHSPAKMGREATVFDLEEPSFTNIKKAIMRAPDSISKIAYTVEFYPEEGKYHFSGHRNCKFVASPQDIDNNGNMCPVCRRRLTEGVDLRIKQLAGEQLKDRVEIKKKDAGLQWFTDKLNLQPPFVKLVPLLEIVAESLYSTVASQKSKKVFTDLCASLGSEMEVLLKSSIIDIERVGGERIAEGVSKVRAGDIAIHPGYDGEYGKVSIWNSGVKKEKTQKITLSKGQLGLDI